ncbi:MAG: hypothetical protein JST38_03410 [Bacteroidetes bacterium]|nr:hypothetical protein [Bacteroidota bacterium]MBS1944715.1 hypothetical protein [Bacteroidota bacterium]
MTTTEKFESWAKVELFGHSVIIGKVSEAAIGGCNFLRVDVPAQGEAQAFTKFYGNGAVYAMTPVSEEVALRLLNNYRATPINTYELRALPMKADADVDEEDLMEQY